ncbi:hypothetical protein [Nocardia huaxiensis]|uniref:DUF1772 domain-containing protein n=1 Tax=Nocardia huaxiensis TaxID=2755382 RepID=A0A7D6ZHR0_9NOCA|nr:hypothetical protein [Nocardia huaxiensis]QLY28263.1 hypothetical protein H0264_23055 [Nocardia huaxiensis]UFS98301.1 hypothetical protein LPY97_10585 [Nocardia huaxiensis]
MTYRIPAIILGGYATVAFFVFSATVAETWLLYPNIFRDIPESLVLTEQFMSVIAVGDVMRPLGGVMTLSALIALAAALRYRIGRRWLGCSLAALLSGQFLLSILYLWPRASILFDDRAQHTADEIDRAATEFVTGQYLRIAAAGLAAGFAVLAALQCHRALALSAVPESRQPSRPA